MIHNVIKSYADKHVTPVDESYLFSSVYGRYKGIQVGDFILIERDSRICKYKVHHIQYFTPHSEEFFGKLLWVGYEK